MDPATGLIIVSGALAVSEALSLIPVLRSNGIFQLVYNVLAFLAGKEPINRRRRNTKGGTIL